MTTSRPRWRPSRTLHAPDALELLGKAPDPASAARLTLGQIIAALKRARRRNTADKAAAIRAALRSMQLAQPDAVVAAYAVTTRASVAVLITLNEQIDALAEAVQGEFSRAPGR